MALIAEHTSVGKTYPQEGPVDFEGFTSYFFGATTILGIVSKEPQAEGREVADATAVEATLDELKDGRSWKECLGGTYYV